MNNVHVARYSYAARSHVHLCGVFLCLIAIHLPRWAFAESIQRYHGDEVGRSVFFLKNGDQVTGWITHQRTDGPASDLYLLYDAQGSVTASATLPRGEGWFTSLYRGYSADIVDGQTGGHWTLKHTRTHLNGVTFELLDNDRNVVAFFERDAARSIIAAVRQDIADPYPILLANFHASHAPTFRYNHSEDDWKYNHLPRDYFVFHRDGTIPETVWPLIATFFAHFWLT